MRFVSMILASLAALVGDVTAAHATDCSKWRRFSSNLDYLAPLSVPADEIGAYLSASEWSDGVKFTATRHGGEIWVDITTYPGTTTAAAGPRAIMMMGRLMDASFDRLVLADEGEGFAAISEPELRAIGCRFIWGVEGGENPIALLRELYQPMVWYESGQLLSENWSGSLLGDTSLAISVSTEIIVPHWVMSAVK